MSTYGYLSTRRRPLEHRVPGCKGAWEVTCKPGTSYGRDEEFLDDVQLLCRSCGHYHRLTASSDAEEDYRATACRGWGDEESAPRPPEQHRPHLALLTGPLAHLVESVPSIRAHGLTLVAVDQVRFGGAETVVTWEARDSADPVGDPVGLVLRDRGPRGGELWAYMRLNYQGPGAPGATGYSSPRAAAKHLAQRLAAADPSGAAGGDA